MSLRESVVIGKHESSKVCRVSLEEERSVVELVEPTDSPQKTGVLSDSDIDIEIASGRIFYYSPDFAAPKLGNCSMDVRLGQNVWRVDVDETPFVLNPWSPPKNMWKLDEGVISKGEHGVPAGNSYHFLAPGEMILAHTIEFVGGVSGITTMMKARSSLGRYGVTVCKCAGWGDIGFFNRWTLEITNGNPYPLVLVVGEYIAQIVFMYAGATRNPYHVKGSYQTLQNGKEVVSSWTPVSMLPKVKSVRDAGTSPRSERV